jgi:hypothetical protein
MKRALLVGLLLASCDDRPPATLTPADAGAGADAADAPTAADGPLPDLAVDADPGPPSRCRVTTEGKPPFPLKFRLSNRSSTPVYVHDNGCVGISFDIASCAAGFTDHLGPVFACACNCRDPGCQGPVSCGACAEPTGKSIAAGQSIELPWNAIKLDFQTRTNDTCVDPLPLPAGQYSVSVPLFDSADVARSGGTPARVAGRTFTLPAPGDLVELIVAPPAVSAPPPCEMPTTVPVCAPPWSSDVACALDSAYTIAWEGGNGLWSESSQLTPPNAYKLTRRYAEPQPELACTNALPRCGAGYDRFTTADLIAALGAPDVVAAFAQPTPLLYGYDSRANDGSVLVLRRPDGHGLLIGGRCGIGSPCAREVTAGMAHLESLIIKLLDQQRAAPGCEALRSP